MVGIGGIEEINRRIVRVARIEFDPKAT